MSIQFTCPTCPKVFKVPDMVAGRRAKCTACDAKFIIPSPFFQTGTSATASGRLVGIDAAPQLGPRKPNLVGILSAVAILVCVFLPWVHTTVEGGSILAFPGSEDSVGPMDIALAEGAMTKLGFAAGVQPLPALARFGFFLIPILGLVALLREFSTFGQGRVPRVAYLMAAVAPIVAGLLVAQGLLMADLADLGNPEHPTAAELVAAGDGLGDEAGLVEKVQAGLPVIGGRLAVGALLAMLGMLGCLGSAIFIQKGLIRAKKLPSDSSTGSAEYTAMFRNQHDYKTGSGGDAAAIAAHATANANAPATATKPATVAGLDAATAAAAAVAVEDGAIGDAVERAEKPTEEMAAYGHESRTVAAVEQSAKSFNPDSVDNAILRATASNSSTEHPAGDSLDAVKPDQPMVMMDSLASSEASGFTPPGEATEAVTKLGERVPPTSSDSKSTDSPSNGGSAS